MQFEPPRIVHDASLRSARRWLIYHSMPVTDSTPYPIPGRGKHYSRRRGVVEGLLRVLFASGWPARVWGRIPGATAVRTVHESVAIVGSLRTPLRVAFASDLHLGPTTPAATLDRAFELLTA